MYTAFPRIVSAKTILCWKLECGKYLKEETILFLNLDILANSNGCLNISIFTVFAIAMTYPDTVFLHIVAAATTVLPHICSCRGKYSFLNS